MLLITLLKKDLIIIFKDVKLVALILLLPVICITFFSAVLSGYIEKGSFVEPFKIGIIDEEDSKETRMLIDQLEEIDILEKVIKINAQDQEKYIKDNMVAAIIIIPENFSKSLVEGKNYPVTVIGNRNIPLESYIARNIVVSAAKMVSANQAGINTIFYFNKSRLIVED